MERRPGLGRPETGWRGNEKLQLRIVVQKSQIVSVTVRATRKKQAGAGRGFPIPNRQWRIMRGDHGKKKVHLSILHFHV